MTTATKQLESAKRKIITMREDRINFNDVFERKSFEEAAEALEQIRLRYLEHQMLYNCTVRIESIRYATVVRATRIESDAEYEERQEKLRIQREKAAIRREKKKNEMSLEERRERALLKKLKEKYEPV